MGLVKTRRLAAMQKKQKAKAGKMSEPSQLMKMAMGEYRMV